MNLGGAVQVHGGVGAPSILAPARFAAPAVRSSLTTISGSGAPELLVTSMLKATAALLRARAAVGALVMVRPPPSAVGPPPAPSSTGGTVVPAGTAASRRQAGTLRRRRLRLEVRRHHRPPGPAGMRPVLPRPRPAGIAGTALAHSRDAAHVSAHAWDLPDARRSR